jgi:hypothetical protein
MERLIEDLVGLLNQRFLSNVVPDQYETRQVAPYHHLSVIDSLCFHVEDGSSCFHSQQVHVPEAIDCLLEEKVRLLLPKLPHVPWVVISVVMASCCGVSFATDTHRPQQQSSGITWAQQAMAALTGGAQLTGVTESGSVVWSIGGNQGTGSLSMGSTGVLSSQLTLSTGAGNRSEIRTWGTDGSGPAGQWIDLQGQPHPMAQQNCWTEPVWFFPALSMLSDYSDPTLAFTDMGQLEYNGHSVEHIQVYRSDPALPPDVAGQLAMLSTVDYYLDSQTYLPLAIGFAIQDDQNVNAKAPVLILLSQYQVISGIQVPFQVTRLLNGSPMYQITVTSAVPSGQGLPVHQQ